ncbi:MULTISPECIES: cation:proton antiporter regulatory subunit [unclassified Haladaptatus]|uniref:cation:proton antiporter regulatory subunit n=1 Tax=unclassified Haladaptatus TaxID=2622732 RepID=UPI0023E85ABA|nr:MULTISPECIES: TrkA C-terminal domain-containing protein [unclassified Haladaptatus]
MTVYESDIPGVGRKFELELGGGARLITLIHHDGHREVFYRANPDADSQKLFDLDSQRARQFGSILEGAYFESVAVENLSVPLGNAIINWEQVPADSPLSGKTLADTNIRAETGASVIAIQRGEETIPNPDPTATIEPGDYLVALGTREQVAALNTLLASGA